MWSNGKNYKNMRGSLSLHNSYKHGDNIGSAWGITDQAMSQVHMISNKWYLWCYIVSNCISA